MAGITVLYASVGPRLLQYRVDLAAGSLELFGELKLPDIVQYAWADSRRTHLYAACSDGAPPPAPAGSNHRLVAMRIDPATGALAIVGRQAVLPGRAVHLTLDATDRHALVAYNNPPGATVHAIAGDGTLEADTGQAQEMDFGHYPHQIRVTPCNGYVVVVSRGTRPGHAGHAQGTPGALKVAAFAGGQLKMHASVAPNGGVDFGPRHLDFHPTGRWVYVSLELENKLQVFGLDKGQFSSAPLFVRETLVNPAFVAPSQMAGTIHVHPNGRTVYLINRANGTAEFEGRPFYAGGDNTMAVYAIDQQTGEPTLIQAEDTRGMHARTFSIDPTGSLLVAAHNSAVEVRNTSSIGSHVVPGGLSVFRVREDGRLAFLRRVAIDTDRKNRVFWSKLYAIGG